MLAYLLAPPPGLHVPHGLFYHIFNMGDSRSVSFCVPLRLDRVVLETVLPKFVDFPSLQGCPHFLDKKLDFGAVRNNE